MIDNNSLEYTNGAQGYVTYIFRPILVFSAGRQRQQVSNMMKKIKGFPSSTLFSLESLTSKSHNIPGPYFKSHRNKASFCCWMPKALWGQGHSHFIRCSVLPY